MKKGRGGYGSQVGTKEPHSFCSAGRAVLAMEPSSTSINYAVTPARADGPKGRVSARSLVVVIAKSSYTACDATAGMTPIEERPIHTAMAIIIRFSVNEMKPSGTLLDPPTQAHLSSRLSM